MGRKWRKGGTWFKERGTPPASQSPLADKTFMVVSSIINLNSHDLQQTT